MVVDRTTSFLSLHIFFLPTNSRLSDNPGHPDEEHHTPDIQHAANLEEEQWVPHLQLDPEKQKKWRTAVTCLNSPRLL